VEVGDEGRAEEGQEVLLVELSLVMAVDPEELLLELDDVAAELEEGRLPDAVGEGGQVRVEAEELADVDGPERGMMPWLTIAGPRSAPRMARPARSASALTAPGWKRGVKERVSKT
jgi:hypothetical protein